MNHVSHFLVRLSLYSLILCFLIVSCGAGHDWQACMEHYTSIRKYSYLSFNVKLQLLSQHSHPEPKLNERIKDFTLLAKDNWADLAAVQQAACVRLVSQLVMYCENTTKCQPKATSTWLFIWEPQNPSFAFCLLDTERMRNVWKIVTDPSVYVALIPALSSRLTFSHL